MNFKSLALTVVALALGLSNLSAQSGNQFNGLGLGLGNFSLLSNAETRSISPENFTGEKAGGARAVPTHPSERNVNNGSWGARDLGQGWKVNPCIHINSGETVTLAEIEGPGAIQHIWMTPTGVWRWSILRIYWDDETTPSVECPVGDFFGQGWNEYAPLVSLPICVNPGSGFNSYWEMPFRKKCKITMENVNPRDQMTLFYQINYTLTEVPDNAAYFHAQWRRTRYNENSDFVVVDGIKGQGHYVGVYMAWGLHNNGWWGEGEMKFYLDGDDKFPTICTTGAEDYFCGSYGFDRDGKYVEFCTPYAGLVQVLRPDGTYRSQHRMGLYRWHIMDPIRFKKDFKATMQDLGWRFDGHLLPQHSDMAATTFWYQSEPHAPFPEFPSWEDLEVY